MTRIMNKIGCAMLGGVLGALALASCSEKIDESNLYTFTGQTIIDYLRSNEQLSEFVQISDSAGMSDRLSAYGTYTCFAPTNEAVEHYLDSLYNDKSRNDHNKLYADESMSLMDRLMHSEKRDSLCKDIVESQVTGNKKTSNDLYAGTDVTMMLGNTQTPKRVGDDILMDGISKLTERDLEMENGIVHIINRMFYRSNNLITDEMERLGNYKIWCEALKLTSLSDSLTATERTSGIDWLTIDATTGMDFPKTCKMGYTIFAETDDVLRNNQINSVEDLARVANQAYQNCAEWYNYVRDNGIQVSTGTDYKNPWNALNMFLRYHILKYVVSSDKLTYSYNELPDLDVFEYYRTMLPYTMFKVTGVKEHGTVAGTYINRQLANPTMTEIAGNTNLSSSAYINPNTVVSQGIQVGNDQVTSRQASNGYIHPINGLLVYNASVPNNVLNERMRFDFMSLLDESITNRFRGYTGEDLKSAFGRSEAIRSVRFPSGYFQNMVVYNGNASNVTYLTKDHANGNMGFDCWNDYQGDELFITKSAFDFAIKLPPVPKDGTYELRFGYTANGKRTIIQFFMGNSTDRNKMEPLDIPLDQDVEISDASIGWSVAQGTDQDAIDDKAMHNRGWMRGPHYFTHFKGGSGLTPRFYGSEKSQRHIRRIITKANFTQGETYWLRCKTAKPEDTSREFELDYIELVPVSVYNNTIYSEDVF